MVRAKQFDMKPVNGSKKKKRLATDALQWSANYGLASGKNFSMKTKLCPDKLTIALNAARCLTEPGSRAVTNDAGGSICGVSGLTAIGQNSAHGKGVPVSLSSVHQVSVLHGRRLRTTCTKNKNTTGVGMR